MSNYWTWEGPKNWWHAAPEGAWTFIEPRSRYIEWMPGILLLLFGWMMINTEYSLLAIVYFLMVLFAALIYCVEAIASRKILAATIMPRMTPTLRRTARSHHRCSICTAVSNKRNSIPALGDYASSHCQFWDIVHRNTHSRGVHVWGSRDGD